MANNLALILTPLLFFAVVRVVEAWRNPSPVADVDPSSGVKVQVTAGSDPSDPSRGREVATRDESAEVDSQSRRDEVAEWMATNADGRKPAELMRAAMAVHRVSRSTAKRAWRKVRGGGQ